MYEAQKARVEEVRTRYERDSAARSAEARATADEYLKVLTELIESVDHGPVADPEVAQVDTTGELHRVEEYAAWAEQERHRVRRAMNDLP